MVGKYDDIEASTSEGHESARAGKHYHPSRYACVSVEWRDGCWDFEAGIAPSEVERIAALAQISEDQKKSLTKCLRAIVLSHAMCVASRDEITGRHFTRRQLLDELSKLTVPCESNDLPVVPPWLVDELMRIEARRNIEAKIGSTPRRYISNKELLQMSDVVKRASENAEKRVVVSLTDASALLELAADARRAVSGRSETGQEYLATKRALKPEKSLIANAVLGFWTDQLERPPAVTKVLTAFADAVYRLCGIEMKVEAVKGQLHVSVRQRPSQT